MLSAALSYAGYKTGFYSSPHLINVCERFRIDGKAISEDRLSEIVSIIEPHICEMRKNGSSPTYFEVTTAIAANYFALEKADFVIWETGMGGRYDATNIVIPELSVITGIGIDHSSHLGSTIEEIAFEKAGIIKEGVPLFCGELPKEAENVIVQIADEQNAECFLISDSEPISIERLSLIGEYQKKNAKLAILTLKYLSSQLKFDLNKSLVGLKNIRWPGRFQIIDDRIIVDGAHNPQAVESLVVSLKTLYPGRKYKIIFASLKDKDTINVLKILSTIGEEFIFPEIQCSREMVSPSELIEMTQKIEGIKGEKVTCCRDGIQSTSNDNILVTGSLYLVGQVLEELLQEEQILNIYNTIP
jgi:dihydrofolate synthase/folylpolyglutamate synthase